MTPKYPGAVWLPTGDNGTMPNGPDACSFHEAVTRAPSVFGWVQSAKACHAYVGQDGTFEQYMDFDGIAYGVKDGNSHVITIESFDGLLIDNTNGYRELGLGGLYGDSADTGRWDDGQLERFADVAAWMHLNLGIELVCSSRAGDPGFGGHRLGIEPWRSTLYGSGESWTAHDGKPCPGDLRMLQIPGIIARAQTIAAAVTAGAAWLPAGPVDVPAALARTNSPSQIGFLMSLTDAQQTQMYVWLESLCDPNSGVVKNTAVVRANTLTFVQGQSTFADSLGVMLAAIADSLGSKVPNVVKTAQK